MEPLLLYTMLVIGFIVAFAIGSNDETMSPAVGARVFSLNMAITIGAIINLLGAVFMGCGVSEKVGSDLIHGQPLTTTMVFAILIAMAVWLLLASASKGLPISTTQCIVGSVIGITLFSPFLGESGWGILSIDWNIVFQILVGWLISPLIGFFIAAFVYTIVSRIRDRAEGLSSRERQEQIAAHALVVFLIITSLSRGGNDVANAVSPLLSLPEFTGNMSLGFVVIPLAMVPLLLGGFGMALGLMVIGRKVVKTLATEVVTLSPTSALSASVSVSLVMFVGTIFGLPLSGTHVIVAALIAVGWVGKTQLQLKQVKNILISWVITVPISAVFGIAVFTTLKTIMPFLGQQ